MSGSFFMNLVTLMGLCEEHFLFLSSSFIVLCEEHFLCVASFFAALIFAVNFALDCKGELYIVFLTKEWRHMLIIHFFVAFFYFKVLQLNGYFVVLNYVEISIGIIVYQMLLHSSVLTFSPIGLEYLLLKFESKFRVGIKQSIHEQRAKLLGEWRQIGIQKLDPIIRDYLTSHGKDVENVEYIKKLLDDVKNNPDNEDDNGRVIFDQISKCAGGQRGIRWIMKKSKNV